MSNRLFTAERSIRTEFSEVTSDVIEMALQASDYDEMNTRILIQSMIRFVFDRSVIGLELCDCVLKYFE